MALLSPVTANADVATVGAASVQFSATLAAGAFYVFTSSTACWIKQGSNPTASAAAGSMFLPAGESVVIDGSLGAKLAVIQDAAGGKASLTPVKVM